MKKILISWLAVDNDFNYDDKNKIAINATGPTVNFHAYHYDHAEHILLCTPDYFKHAQMMVNYLKDSFSRNRRIIIKIVDITGVHENLSAIKNKMENILLKNKDKQIDILLSTGSGIMKIAWYICHTTLNLNTRLLQILSPNDSKDPLKPDLLVLNIEKSPVPVSAIIREQNLNNIPDDANVKIVESIEKQYDKAFKLAQADNVSVLITGNTGTGKEILARYIHKKSPRKNKTFIAVNCAALNDQLLESRLFGHKKGSFTGAYCDQKGVFELANNGTVFLDEIGDISPYMQQALLRFLQEKEIQPIGGKTKKVDVRIIAATNKNILQMIKNEQFRADLFFRLGIDINLPDFKDYSADDKIKWINFLLKIKQKEFRRKEIIELTDDVLNFLVNFDFPGNIRQLINIIDNFYVFANKKADLIDLPEYINDNEHGFSLLLKDVQVKHIKKVLKLFNGNKTRAAKALGISVNNLKAKI